MSARHNFDNHSGENTNMKNLYLFAGIFCFTFCTADFVNAQACGGSGFGSPPICGGPGSFYSSNSLTYASNSYYYPTVRNPKARMLPSKHFNTNSKNLNSYNPPVAAPVNHSYNNYSAPVAVSNLMPARSANVIGNTIMPINVFQPRPGPTCANGTCRFN